MPSKIPKRHCRPTPGTASWFDRETKKKQKQKKPPKTKSKVRRVDQAATRPKNRGPEVSENALGDLQSFLLHARQRGAGHRLGARRPRRPALLQHKVVVGAGVHGVEDVGVVGDAKL